MWGSIIIVLILVGVFVYWQYWRAEQIAGVYQMDGKQVTISVHDMNASKFILEGDKKLYFGRYCLFRGGRIASDNHDLTNVEGHLWHDIFTGELEYRDKNGTVVKLKKIINI